MPCFFMLSRTTIPAGPAKSGVSGLIYGRRGSLEEHEIGSYPSPSVWKPETLCPVSSFVNGGFYWDYAWFSTRDAFPRAGNAWSRPKAKDESRAQTPGISLFFVAHSRGWAMVTPAAAAGLPLFPIPSKLYDDQDNHGRNCRSNHNGSPICRKEIQHLLLLLTRLIP